MFNMGFTYITAQHHKAVTEMFGPMPPDGGRKRLAYGSIDAAEDAMEIYRDAARFLRDPSDFDGGPLSTPEAVDGIIGYGFSLGNFTLKEALHTGGLVEEDDSLVLDGILFGGGGVVCNRFTEINIFNPTCGAGNDEPCPTDPTYWFPFPCPAFYGSSLPADLGGIKVMNVQTESEYFGFGAEFNQREWTFDANDVDCADGAALPLFNPDCDPNPDYYNYDLAGIAHIPGPVQDTTFMGVETQNPADFRPFFRGALNNMYEWLENDVAPPDHKNIEGTWDLLAASGQPAGLHHGFGPRVPRSWRSALAAHAALRLQLRQRNWLHRRCLRPAGHHGLRRWETTGSQAHRSDSTAPWTSATSS